MNINEVKANVRSIDYPIVIQNLDLLSKLDAKNYFRVDAGSQKLTTSSWWWSSRPLEIVQAVEATFFVAINKQEDKDIISLYRNSFKNLPELEKICSANENARALINEIRKKYSLESRIKKGTASPITRARTVLVGGGGSRKDKLADEWVWTRWQMQIFLKELNHSKLDPEYQNICKEVKQCLPKAPPTNPEGLHTLLSQLNEAKSRLKKFDRNPIEPPKPKKIIKTAAFCPSEDELNNMKISLKKTVAEKGSESENPFTESIIANREALKKTGTLEKLLEEEERKSQAIIASNPKTRPEVEPLPEVSDNDALFELSPLQQQIYEIKESFGALGPKEKQMQLLESTMRVVMQMYQQQQFDEESSEGSEEKWSSEESPYIEITMEELEGLTDSEDSEDQLEEHTIDPEHKETYGQMLSELTSQQSEG